MEQGPYFNVAGKLADVVLKHELPPVDREGQPVPGGLTHAADDFQALGGRAEGLSCSLPWLADRAVFERRREPEDDELTRKGISRADLKRMQGSGDSPLASYAPISLQMRQACAHHDLCYRHGAATYGYTQAECDYLLQVHSFRLCRFFSSSRDKAKCHTKARLLTIGVRLFGAKHFLPASLESDPAAPAPATEPGSPPAQKPLSTYYEFDPYPTRSPGYRVARIADAPEAWRLAGARARALYVFDIKPSGMRLRVVGWKPAMTRPSFCGEIYIPGGWGRLTTPPFVARTRQDGEAKDWLVFWQRRALEGTGGQFVLISPRHATALDWSLLVNNSHNPFGHRTDDSRIEEPKGANCTDRLPAPKDQPASGTPAGAILDIRKSNDPAKPRDDFNISEFYAVSDDRRADGLLRILGLDRSPCVGRHHCIHEIRLDPKAMSQPQFNASESFRTAKPMPEQDAAPTPEVQDEQWSYGQDIYRSFVTAPLAIGDGAGHTLVLTFRRGGAHGDDYERSLMLRRHRLADSGAPSAYAGEVKLAGLSEDHEPFGIIGRNESGARLVAFHRDKPSPTETAGALVTSLAGTPGKQRGARLALWTLPPAYRDPWSAENRPRWQGDGVKPAFCRNGEAPFAAGGKEQLEIDDTWLARPPLLMPRGPRPFLLLSRIPPMPEVREMPADTGKPRQYDLYGKLETLRVRIHPDGSCTFLPSSEVETVLKASTLKTPESRMLSWKKKFQALPTLLADLDGTGGEGQILVPDLVSPAQSVLANLD